jgi:hypothetical protein
VIGVLVVHAAAGEDPRAAHEALLGIALHEQHFGAVGGVAQDDDRRRLAGLGHLAFVPLLAGMGALHPHRRSLPP